MYNIRPEKLKENLIKKINLYYIFLGEDYFLLKKNQDLILQFANKKGFSNKIEIDIENSHDWNRIINFYKKRNLFSIKIILVVNFLIKKLSSSLIENINKTSFLLNLDILMILKFNHLSTDIQKNKLLNRFKFHFDIVCCLTPYNLNFINWIKYEIREKKIKIEKKAFFLLCKYYEGNTLFICKVLEAISVTWPDTYITETKIKKIIVDFFVFFPLHWIDSIFQSCQKKSLYILNTFYKKKYSPLILIRSLQKDLLILINIKREKKTNINMFLKRNNIWNTRYVFFHNAIKNINHDMLFKGIKILSKIEINIKQKYDHSVWILLQELTLTLSQSKF